MMYGVQVTDCYSEPHIFVEVSDLQPWMIISFNAGALKTIGMLRTILLSVGVLSPMLGKTAMLSGRQASLVSGDRYCITPFIGWPTWAGITEVLCS